MVSGVDEHAFHLLIKFLYGAPLSITAMNTETVFELMVVADRWECLAPVTACKGSPSTGTTVNTWHRLVKGSWCLESKIVPCFNC